MAEEYTCNRCGYLSDDITNFRRHLTRKSVCEAKFQDIDINVLRNEYLAPQKNKTLSCDSCNKQFASRSGLHVHKKKCVAPQQIQEVQPEINLGNNELEDETYILSLKDQLQKFMIEVNKKFTELEIQLSNKKNK